MIPDDSRFEAVLREGLSRRELPDAGFTGRVMASLAPAVAPTVLPYYRTFIFFGWIGAATGTAIALWACLPWPEISASPTLDPSRSGLAAFEWTIVALAMALAGCATAWCFRDFSRES